MTDLQQGADEEATPEEIAWARKDQYYWEKWVPDNWQLIGWNHQFNATFAVPQRGEVELTSMHIKLIEWNLECERNGVS